MYFGKALLLLGIQAQTNTVYLHTSADIRRKKTQKTETSSIFTAARTAARASVGERVAQVCHLLLGLERSLPAGIWPVHRQLVEAVGLEDLSGGVGSGLTASRWAAVARFPHEVDTAVDGTIRQHGARLLHRGGRQNI